MELIGKITGINTSDGMCNIAVIDKEGNLTNLKLGIEEANGLKNGSVFKFLYNVVEGERISNYIYSINDINDLELVEKDSVLRAFFPNSPISLDSAKKEINNYLNKIDNKVIKDITKGLINKYNNDFFTYPAATKMHHAYIGGLAYHSVGMLHMADSFIENYPYLNKDYIYAGIMLHDIGKTIELTGAANAEYSLKGQLLGHLVIGAMEIGNMAKALGYEDNEEVLFLEHMLVSHHGMPQFGSAKKPMTAEALVLWYIDTIDSKFRVLGEELSKTEKGTYTESIGVLDRAKIYKI